MVGGPGPLRWTEETQGRLVFGISDDGRDGLNTRQGSEEPRQSGPHGCSIRKEAMCLRRNAVFLCSSLPRVAIVGAL